MSRLQILTGDCRAILPTLPAQSVQCCVTSPPYWGLRDYGTNGQLGLEARPQEYIANMVGVFRAVGRVLRDDGTLWLNMGDSYAGGAGGRGDKDREIPRCDGTSGKPSQKHNGERIHRDLSGLKPKDLCMMPARLAMALQADGWYLRSEIVWHKPNPMPESVTDRPTKAHEMIYLLAKQERYFYDAEAIKEPHSRDWSNGACGGSLGPNAGKKMHLSENDPNFRNGHSQWERNYYPEPNPAGRNKRSVWTIATQPNSDSVYDFEGADYVDRRGIPRKWSPDCLIHERDGQPRRESHATVSCGELKAAEFSRNERNGVNHVQERGCAVSPIGDYKTNQVEDSSSCVPIDDTCENKKLSGFRLDEREILTGTTHTQSQSVPSMTDSDRLSCAEPAILHNIGDRKSGHVGQMPNDDNVSGQLEFRIQCKEPQLYGIERDGNIGANNTNPCNGHQKSTVEIVSRKNGKYSSTEDKCLCRISQVSHFATFPEEIPKLCILAGSHVGDTVLDPFAGSGTVGQVALELGRKAILIELNPAYIELAEDRTFVTPGFL